MKPKKRAAKKPVRPSRGLRFDAAIVVVILLLGGLRSASYWEFWTAKGNKPIFYQSYFEPAVMIACGKGFVVSRTQPPALEAFLNLRSDRFDCADIPSDAVLGREGLYQGAWRYLLTTVGWFWRFAGVSWSGMGPLFGLLFGLTLVLVYAVCRLGMNRLLAVLAVFAVATSIVHLNNLAHLRDYAKAPLTLGLIFLIGLLVKLQVRAPIVLGLSAAYGALLGIGYGFRTDFLVNLPVLPIVLFFFVDAKYNRQLLLKAGATVVFFAMFMILSWPVTSTVYERGGCQWHVTLLGLQSPFDDFLKVQRAPYDFGYMYVDEYIARNVDAIADRTSPSPVTIGYCTPEYDAQSWKWLKYLIVSFPADFAVRAFGSLRQIVELPFTAFRFVAAPAGWAEDLHVLKSNVLTTFMGAGQFLVALCLVVVSAVSLRLAFFMLFFVLYFGGYPAVQFQDRHYFHLEFITWWVLGFLLSEGYSLWRRKRSLNVRDSGVRRRVAVFCGVAIATLFIPLALLRWYQGDQAHNLFSGYIGAQKESIFSESVTQDGFYAINRRNIAAEFLEVDLNLKSCRPGQTVSFRYDDGLATASRFDRSFSFNSNSGSPGVTRIFILVFNRFSGIEFSGGLLPGCVAGAYRLSDTRAFPLLVNAVLPPNWQELPLYQRLK